MSKFYPRAWMVITSVMAILMVNPLRAQTECTQNTPKYFADLTGKSDSIWTTPFATRREGTCCSPTPGCVEFVVTLDADAYALNLEIASGAFPTGTLTYKIDCEEYERNVGEPACLMGGRTYNITFCKPGNNINTYRITSYGPPTAVAAVNASVNTPGTLTSSGFNPANLRWRSVSPGSPGQYDSYLSNPTAPETQVIIPASENVPSQIVYEVTGNPYIAQCGFMLFRARSIVNIISTSQVSIAVTDTELCPERPTTTLTANGSGGSGRYEYIWSTGETSQTIAVGAGMYSVRLTDLNNTGHSVSDTVEIQEPVLVLANAGTNRLLCSTSLAPVQLMGEATNATSTLWSTTGSGTFSGDLGSLHSTYTPSNSDKAAGGVSLVLQASRLNCSPVYDTIYVFYEAPILVDAGPDQNICSDQEVVTLSGSGSDDAAFNWVSGTGGTFYPNAQAPDAEYILSPLDKQNKQVILVLQANSSFNGACGQKMDTLIVNIDACTITTTHTPKEALIQLYPNPNSGDFYLHVPGAAFARLQLTDLTGKQVFYKELNASEPTHLQLPQSLKGVFLVSIQTGSSTYHKKLFIQ
jgi:hypothetical protein